jgi:hypothetical protein
MMSPSRKAQLLEFSVLVAFIVLLSPVILLLLTWRLEVIGFGCLVACFLMPSVLALSVLRIRLLFWVLYLFAPVVGSVQLMLSGAKEGEGIFFFFLIAYVIGGIVLLEIRPFVKSKVEKILCISASQ